MITKNLTGKFRSKLAAATSADPTRKLRAALAERERTIAELMQSISEQQEQIESLQSESEQVRFQAEILEQGYAKQLAEARERAGQAERTVGEQESQLAEFALSQKRLQRDLDDARARLDTLVGSDSASVDELLESFSVPTEQPRREEPVEVIDQQFSEEMLDPGVMFRPKDRRSQ